MPPLAFDVCIIKWVEAFTERGNGCSTAADDMQVWLYLYNFFGAAICQNRPTCGCNTYLGNFHKDVIMKGTDILMPSAFYETSFYIKLFLHKVKEF